VALHGIEPAFGPGERQPIASVVRQLMATGRARSGPFLLAIDGRSSSGKSTLATRVAAAVPGTSVVHTDDIAWWHSRFGWDDLLVDGVITPLRRGEAVDYRPPAWDARDRPGSITVPADASVVAIEGVGSGRRSLAEQIDSVIWVQADLDITERRDGDRIRTGEIDQAGYEGWMSEEIPFQASERTWERADLIVSGASSVDAPEVLVLRR
jgi:hypothetical protein